MNLEEVKEIFEESLNEYKNTAIVLLYGGASEVIPVGSTLFFKTIDFGIVSRKQLDLDSTFCVFSNEKKDMELRIPINSMNTIATIRKENDAIFGSNPRKVAELTVLAEELLKIDEHATELESAKKMSRIGMEEVGAFATSRQNDVEMQLGNNYSIFPVDISKIKEKVKEKTISDAGKKASKDVREDGINKLAKKAFEREIRRNTAELDDDFYR